MQAQTETTLNTIAGSNDHERLLVVLCHEVGTGSRIELRQQSWGDGVGWFTQNSMILDPQQVGQLRATLGVSGRQDRGRANLPAGCKKITQAGFTPRVIHAETA